MKRKEFLRGASLAGLGLVLPKTNVIAESNRKINFIDDDCVLVPSETAGPFPLDLTANQTFFRQDIRENEDGVQLNLKMKIIGKDNCLPMQNVRVNIWHCDKDGIYSGYNTGMNPGDPNGTVFRGYQFTDANGEVEFITILPGWYNGRICHIHFQVYVSSSYAAISQLTFPITEKNNIYALNSGIYTKGSDPLNFNQDNVFSDGHVHQLADLTENATTGGYNSFLQVAVQGSGMSGIGHIERETAKVLEVGQNIPNPYIDSTTIPIVLKQAAQLKVQLWDLSGKVVATILNERKGAGEYRVEVKPEQHGLTNGNYVYQVEASNRNGVFRLPKMMTFQK